MYNHLNVAGIVDRSILKNVLLSTALFGIFNEFITIQVSLTGIYLPYKRLVCNVSTEFVIHTSNSVQFWLP